MAALSHITCIGDSHVWVLDHLAEHGAPLEHTELAVTGVGGATAFGLANPNSTTNALEVFRQVVADQDARTVLLMLGEIDCGFLAWLRADRDGTSVEQQLAASFERYHRFVDELAQRAATVLVVTVPPPTVPDYSTWGGLDNARRRVTASLRERTDATRTYNGWIRKLGGVRVVDVEHECLDPSTGLVRDALRRADPLDHHLNWDVFAPVMRDGLVRLGYT